MRAWLVLGLVTLGCSTKGEDEAVGLPVLGAGRTGLDSVVFELIGDANDGLNTPRDLAFNPGVPDELWVVNRTDDSVSIFSGAGTRQQSSQHIVDPYAMHFMDEVSSIAFGEPLFEPSASYNFATCHESTNTYNGMGRSNYFMGPTLWSSDPDVFGKSNPEAIEALSDMFGSYTDLGSHLDMLHESPLCMGIAHDYDNVYWVFDGYNESIYRYDFQDDHGVGWDDHNDGIIARYIEGEIAYEPDVPSHLFLDQDSRLLFIADTGNNRIAVMDTESGVQGDSLVRTEGPGTTHFRVDNAVFATFIDGDDFGMVAPTGIHIVDGVLFVSDNVTGEILAFNSNGEVIDRLKTGLPSGSLMGIYVRSMEDIWLVSALENRVYRIRPR